MERAWDVYASAFARDAGETLQRYGYPDNDDAIVSRDLWADLRAQASKTAADSEGSFLIFGDDEEGRRYVAQLREFVAVIDRMLADEAAPNDGRHAMELLAEVLKGWTHIYGRDDAGPVN